MSKKFTGNPNCVHWVAALVRESFLKRFRVNHYRKREDGGFTFMWDHFDTREEAIAFLLDANLACAWDGETKIAESVRSEQ